MKKTLCFLGLTGALATAPVLVGTAAAQTATAPSVEAMSPAPAEPLPPPATSSVEGTSRAPAEPLPPATSSVVPTTPVVTSQPVRERPEASAEILTLVQAMERALRHSPTAQIAALEVERADALIRQVRATSLPTLTGNAVYTRLDHDRVSSTNGQSRVVSAKNQFNANLQFQAPLFAPARWAQWSQAKENAIVLRETSGETRRQLVIAVARAYLAVVAQHRVIEVQERAVAVSRSHDDYARTRVKGGVGRRLDAVRSSQQLATNVAALERSRINLTRAMEALGLLVGTDRPVDVAVVPEFGPPEGAKNLDATLEQRHDVALAQARLRYANLRVHDNWRDYMPTLLAQVQPFYQTPPTTTLPETGWQAQLLLTLPLYDGGARYGAADERAALKGEAEQQLAALLRQCRSEIRLAAEAVKTAEQSLLAAREAARLAREAESMAVLAYEAGASTNLEVIDAERQTRDAETDVLMAEDAVRQSKLDLLIATGNFPEKY